MLPDKKVKILPRDKGIIRTILRYDTEVKTLSLGDFKITVIMLQPVMEKVNNIKDQMDNSSREVETVRG